MILLKTRKIAFRKFFKVLLTKNFKKHVQLDVPYDNLYVLFCTEYVHYLWIGY
ncbi:hypothetical protein CCP3SC1AL1_3210002 [Gammaproteobacteria bacterium]